MDELTRLSHEIAGVCDALNELSKAPDRGQARRALLADRERLEAEQARLLAECPEAAMMMPLPGHPVAEALMS